MVDAPILLMITPLDEPYLGQFKPLLKGKKAFQISANPDSAAEIELYAKSQGIKYIISTNPVVLNHAISNSPQAKKQSISDWAGSLWERGGLTYLFIDPLKQLFSVPYGRFIATRFVSKITQPHTWAATPAFSWEPARPDTIQRWFELFQKATFCAIDIETVSYDQFPDNPLAGERKTIIRSVCYTGLWEDGNIHTIVIPISDAPINELPFWLQWMRKFNMIDAYKIMQNGLYDSFHFVNYHAPVKNYFCDTQSLFHSWYAELPKDLAFITAFTVFNVYFWKDMSKSAQLLQQWEYNARDGWGTMCSFLNLINELPDWAWTNYLMKFPLWVPCLDMNLEGVKCDQKERQRLIQRDIEQHRTCELRLQKWFGTGFNPRSPKQVTALLSFYGSPDITSSGEPELLKFGLRHPINGKFANEILRSRGIGKRISTYLKPHDYSITANKSSKKKSPLTHNGRIYYGLNPDGTDNARLSCGEGANWTGMQIQNQPRDEDAVKSMLVAENIDWRLFEIDNEKSEAYTAAYTSGSESYIETLRMDRELGIDFHRMNGSKFFGLKYEDVPMGLRNDACKRIIYGAGYNMTPPQLLRIMGERAVDNARALLGLPLHFTRLHVCEILLNAYDVAYPEVRGPNYAAIKNHVMSTQKLVSAMGWTRYCFGNPAKNKNDFNAYVAHVPSNLSVTILNKGLIEGWFQIRNRNSKNLRFKAQIHDSIFGQVRVGYEHLILELKKIVQRKVEVVDIKGIKRIMEIPVAAKLSAPGGNWAAMEKFNG